MTREEKHREAFRNHERISGLIHELEKGGRSIELINAKMFVSFSESGYWVSDQNKIANGFLFRDDVRKLLNKYSRRTNR